MAPAVALLGLVVTPVLCPFSLCFLVFSLLPDLPSPLLPAQKREKLQASLTDTPHATGRGFYSQVLIRTQATMAQAWGVLRGAGPPCTWKRFQFHVTDIYRNEKKEETERVSPVSLAQTRLRIRVCKGNPPALLNSK